MLFQEISKTLKSFRMRAPISEAHMETELERYLKKLGIKLTRQKVHDYGRTDITIGNTVIELKRTADATCAKQLDVYAEHYNGLILLCWHATKGLSDVFKKVKQTTDMPLELIELRKEGSIF